MKIAAISTLIYGFLVLAGGVFGYLQAKSVPSLIAGTICGVLILVAGGYMWAGSIPAAYVAGALALLLALFFAYRLTSTGKFMPGGMMLALSFVAVVILVWGVFNSLRQ
ncbi:MAG TPA: TMEM14 family protein [Acidobacteriota bacterium]|nr:TMEM14 family protein [Acidobacteriota bacterium]